MDSFACSSEDHPVTHRDESDITAVELALTLRLRNTGIRRTPFSRSCKADSHLVHSWHERPLNWEAWQPWRSSRDRSRDMLMLTATLVMFPHWISSSWRRPAVVSSTARCSSIKEFRKRTTLVDGCGGKLEVQAGTVPCSGSDIAGRGKGPWSRL